MNDDGLGQFRVQHLIPSDHDFVVLAQYLLQASIEIRLQILIIFHAVRTDEGLDFGIRIPMLAIYFVSANVEVGIREELSHLGNELVEKFVSCLPGRICDGIDGVRFDCVRTGIAGEFRIANKP